MAMLISTTIASAKPLKLPTKHQLVKILKKSKNASLTVTGLDSYKRCDSVSVQSLKILKIGRASSNYYKDSGRYIASNFMVKFRARGSCSFDHRHEFYKDIDRDGYNDYISGTLPIINEPLEVEITTNSYGDWYAGVISFAGKKINSKRVNNHIRNVFVKGKKAMGGRYTTNVVINNISAGKGNGVYYKNFAVSNKMFMEYRIGAFKSDVQKIFGSSYRPATWNDIVNYANKGGNVKTLFKQLKVSPKKGLTISSSSTRYDRFIADCSIFKNGNLITPSQMLKKDFICLSKPFRRDERKILVIRK